MPLPKYVIQRLRFSTVRFDRCHESPNRRAQLLSPPLSVAIPSEWPRTGASSARCLRYSLTYPIYRQVTIEKLSNEALLKIFRYFSDASPRFWPRLVHICRRWRRIVFASQRVLQLRLFCTHGTPVSQALYCWPDIPIIVQYGGSPTLDPPAPEEDGDIMVALKQPGRVSSISLTVTRSLLAKFSTIKEPFSGLDELVLLSRDSTQLTLPSAFRWGPRLRRLHSTGIALPALLRHPSSSRHLVDIQLHDISNGRYLSPKALAKTLSGMDQLRSLSLRFRSATNHITIPPRSGKRVILPALTHLRFRGITKYLEDLLSRVNAPHLGDIDIAFLDGPIIGLSSLPIFIPRLKMHESLCQADILFSEHSVSISLTRPETPTCLKIQVFCGTSSCQLLCITRICCNLSAFLLQVKVLRISAVRLPSEQDDSTYAQWRRLACRFTNAKRLYVDGEYEQLRHIMALWGTGTMHIQIRRHNSLTRLG